VDRGKAQAGGRESRFRWREGRLDFIPLIFESGGTQLSGDLGNHWKSSEKGWVLLSMVED